MRLIDADALMEMLNRHEKDCNPDHFDGHETFIDKIDAHDSYGEWQFANGFNLGIVASIVDAEHAPTVDVESLITKHEDIGYEKGYRDGYAEALEVEDDSERHGYWCFEEFPDGYYHWECSECKKWFKEDSMSLAEEWKYCPNCGAKMNDVEEEE